MRWALNTRLPQANAQGPRRYADLGLNPAEPTFNINVGESTYNGVNIGVRRRMDKNIQMNVWYSLSKATGRGGNGVDELTSALVQDATDPYGDMQNGPAGRTDARHKVTLSAVINLPWGIYVSPVYRYRSALPMHIWTGYDVNTDGASNDIYGTAYAFTGVDDAGVPSFKEIGACETVNCGRGASLSQFNFRVSKTFRLPGGMNLEGIFETFNLFNSINPAFNAGIPAAGALFTGTAASPTPNAVFMKPNALCGRRRPARAAGRPARFQVHLLVADRTSGSVLAGPGAVTPGPIFCDVETKARSASPAERRCYDRGNVATLHT